MVVLHRQLQGLEGLPRNDQRTDQLIFVGLSGAIMGGLEGEPFAQGAYERGGVIDAYRECATQFLHIGVVAIFIHAV